MEIGMQYAVVNVWNKVSDTVILLANHFLGFKTVGVHSICIIEHHVVLQRLTAAEV